MNSFILQLVSKVGIVSALVLTVMFISNLTMISNIVYAHHVIGEIQVAARPMKMSQTGDLLFVSNMGEPIISVINTSANTPLEEINTKSGVMAVKAVPEKNKLYVAEFESGGVDVYDLSTKKFLKTIVLPHSRIDLTPSSTDTAKVPVILLTGAWSLDYNSKNGKLYVANYNANEVSIIDTSDDTIIKSIQISAHPYTVKADPVTNTILVTSLAGNRLTFISSVTDQITGTLETGTMPWGLDIDSDRHMAYVTNRGNYYITVVDIISKEIVTKIPLAGRAEAIAVDPSEHKIYVSFTDQPNIVKIDGNTNQIENIIEMEGVPIDLLANPATHDLYAAIKFQDKIFVIGPKSTSTTVPVVKIDTPTAILGNISFHGQDAVVSEPFIDAPNKTLNINVHSLDGGNLNLKIPRAILDSQQNGTDTSFKILVDGKAIEYQQTASTPNYRELAMFIPKDSQAIKIIGTKVPIGEVIMLK